MNNSKAFESGIKKAIAIKNIIVVVIPAVIADFIFTLVFGIIKDIRESINAININPIT